MSKILKVVPLAFSVDGSNMLNVLELLLPHKSRYYNIGIGLRLRMEFLDEIEEKFDSDPCKALRKVLGAWLQQKYDVPSFGPPTWQLLVKAIDNPAAGNDHQLAEKIALDHPAGEWTIEISMTNSYITSHSLARYQLLNGAYSSAYHIGNV